MALFTRRGGKIIYYGLILLSCSMAFAGYNSLSTFTEPIVEGMMDDLDTMEWYPAANGSRDVGGSDFFPILGATAGEVLLTYVLGTVLTIDSNLIYYTLVIGLMMILGVVIGLPFSRLGAGPKSVEINRRLGKEKGFAGDYLLVEVEVKNRSINQIPVLEVYDAYPDVFELVLGENFLTTQLNPLQTLKFSYVVRMPIRGKFIIGPCKVITHDRMGFYSDEAVLADISEILVLPSYQDIQKLMMVGKKRQLGAQFGAHKMNKKGGGTDFFGIRDYVPEDSMKFVDWKATSRLGKMMVREYEIEQNIRVLTLLDSSMSMGAGLPRNTKLEYSIRASVLMTFLALEKKDMIGLAVVDEEVREWIQPTGNQKVINQVLDVLAYVQPRGENRWSESIDYLISRQRRSCLFVIITDLEAHPEDILDAVRKLRVHKHHVIVISPFGPWFEIVSHELDPTDKLIGEAIVEELIGMRRELFKKLQAYNCTVISVGPDDMLPVVMQQFARARKMGLGSV
ncbi:MAG: DUF58 domain-containing protein [Candidatus Kariarchaeaceae archaeon]